MISVDIGEERTRIAVTDLNTNILADRVERLAVGEGPDVLLDKITATVWDMISQADLGDKPVAGIGLGLPAPVDYDAGRVLGWSIMSGWDGYDIRGHLRQTWPVPILIDNDVNLLTLAEHRRYWPDQRHLLYIKAGTGVGSGMVISGSINRGAQGAAGDIGHAHIPGFGDPLCRCGNLGCLESLVGGWALARDLRNSQQINSHDARDVADRVKRGDSEAVASLRAAGRVLGEAVAYATSLLNPNVIVIGGILGTTGDHMLAGVREVIYQRALPLATRQLRILPTKYGSRAGIAGAGYLVRDHVLNPATLDTTLAVGGSPFDSLGPGSATRGVSDDHTHVR
jgi:predicted NBD/HSP70 family sugar kinase